MRSDEPTACRRLRGNVSKDPTIGIRPMELADIPQVVQLVAAMTESRSERELARFLEQALFAQPWADPEIPSLVYVDGGEILGTIAASLRRARFDGRPIRMVCSSFFYTHPSVRGRGVGPQLLRALLAGPQDITIADRATETVRLLWESFGGRVSDLGCLSFVRIFRPWRLGAERLAGKRPQTPLMNSLARITVPLDFATNRVARSLLEPSVPKGDVEALTPSTMMENLTAVIASVRFRLDYDEAYLEWLYGQLDELADHERLCEIVRRNGRPIGWYIALSQPGGLYRVLQIAAQPRETKAILEHLFHRAWERGATAVVGRLERNLVPALHCLRGPIAYTQTERMLIHARDRELVDAVLSGDRCLTRLDGEW